MSSLSLHCLHFAFAIVQVKLGFGRTVIRSDCIISIQIHVISEKNKVWSTIREGFKTKKYKLNLWSCSYPLRDFCHAPNIVDWIYEAPKQTLCSLRSPKFLHTRRCGPLRGPSSSSCGGLLPSAEAFFCPSGKKISFYVCFLPNFGHFWWSVVTSVTFSSNLRNL